MANNTLYQKMRQSNHGGEHAISCHGACCLRGTDLGLRMGDDTVFEREPLEALCRDGELMAFRHRGFWQCMDTVREKETLEKLWAQGQAPWKVWAD